jgi:hemoglobin
VAGESGQTETLYEHAGGDEGLHRLEQIFYDKVLADRVLAPLFGAGQPHHVEHLTWFTAETFGGPDRFTKQLGFGHLIDVHRGLQITDEQRQRFIELYLEAASEAGLPDDRPFRDALREHIEFGAKVAQQNSRARTDAELYPLHEVPRWDWNPAAEAQR